MAQSVMMTGTSPVVEFCGELRTVDTGSPGAFTIGRDADLVLDDDNRFLHRHFLALGEQQGMWLLHNVGSQLTATVSDSEGRLEAFLAPGAVLPLVFAHTIVRCTAGPTTYEFSILFDEPAFRVGRRDDNPDGTRGPTADTTDATVGRVDLTPEQLVMIVALAEPALRGDGRASTMLPSSTDAAIRLGWTITKFNRKLDNVCSKLAANGVRGLHGDAARLASNRRARLVEYALAVRLVTRADLELLHAMPRG
ncbi:MAG TPA: hypothetical protein VMM60_18545 [Ilumatobacter sp.]|nr:hypothetical protein [Ilumatobacter sp.]